MKNIPSGWSRFEHSAKCDFLIRTGQAKDFRHACQLLARVPRNKPRPTTRRGKAVNVVEGAWYRSGGYA